MFDFMDMSYDDSAEPGMPGIYIPDATECMRCGLCVSSCPTFRIFQVDEETPRRRLRTLSKLLVDDLPISADEQKHLENCLQCRACETACPSKVAYGQLFEQAQIKLNKSQNTIAKLAFKLIEKKIWLKRLLPLLTVYLKSGLQKPVRRSGLLKKLYLSEAEALLVDPALEALAEFNPTTETKYGTVALFTGCIAEHFDRETLLAAIQLLNAIGYDVQVPKQQSCCGAIHQHNGMSATRFFDNNIAVFNAVDVDAVLYTASGCGAMLSEYQSKNGTETELFRSRLVDANDFLLNHWRDNLQLKPTQLKVAIHEPCSQRNILKNQQSIYALLQKIPGISITALNDNNLCCGAGGSYFLTHPDNARQLRTLKKQAIKNTAADRVVSCNIGCTLYLNAKGESLAHPLVLLAAHII